MPGKRLTALFFFLPAAGLFAEPAPVAPWPDYRGPGHQGHVAAAGLALRWSEDENVVWKTPIPGRGHSSPVIAGDSIWLTTALERGGKKKSLHAICVDRSRGKIRHNRRVFDVDEPPRVHRKNTHASPSAVIAGSRVFVHFGNMGTAGLDVKSGEVLWRNDDFKIDHSVGPGSSPMVFKDLLVLVYDGKDAQFVVALSTETGDLVWKTHRPELPGVLPPQKKSFCTPLVIQVAGKPQLVSPAAFRLFAYEPASGREIWRVRHDGFSVVPRPLFDGTTLFVLTGFEQPSLLAIRPDGRGDVTDTHVLWTYRKQVSLIPCALLVDGHIYMVSIGGIVTCVEAESGHAVWRKRLPGEYASSPICVGDRIYLSNEAGLTTVIQTGREFKKLATSQLEEGIYASPAVADRSLFLRTEGHLYRIED